MSYPLVSVIIPNYNHSKFLVERIESVLTQDYCNLEVFILDDCSTDNSREIIEQYRYDGKIKDIIYNETNSGSTFKQWEKGFSKCTGEYVWIAESDDVADPQFVSYLISIINNDKKIVMAVSDLVFIDENGAFIKSGGVNNLKKSHIYDGNDFIKTNMLLDNHILNASSVIFRRDSLNKIDKTYLQFKAAGDYLFWVEIASKGNVLEVPRKLDYFRRTSNCVTPRLFANGVAISEVYKIYDIISKKMHLNWFYKHAVIGFRLSQINKNRSQFNSENIWNECYQLWADQTYFPMLDIVIRYFFSIKRILKRFLINSVL